MWCAGIDGGQDKHFTDRDVCRPFLLDICISDLFTNTVRHRECVNMLFFMIFLHLNTVNICVCGGGLVLWKFEILFTQFVESSLYFLWGYY